MSQKKKFKKEHRKEARELREKLKNKVEVKELVGIKIEKIEGECARCANRPDFDICGECMKRGLTPYNYV